MLRTDAQLYDLVIIGAGLYGIQAGRTYLERHPTHNVVIFEASSALGGVWSSERMYDDFWTQTPLGIAGFSDALLENVPQSDQYYRFFAARHITSYLEEYVDSHVYSGLPLRSRLRFNSRVEKLSKVKEGWVIRVLDHEGEYISSRVIDASGLTSTPNIPSIPGLENFEGEWLHHKSFGKSDLLCKEDTKNIAVIGGAKSAADVAYAAAKAGKNVTWIIRRSGSGPAAFFSVIGPRPYRNSNESFYTRFTGYCIASIFANYPTWIGWLYRTSLGKKLFDAFWRNVNAKCHKAANYERLDGQNNGFYNLKPDTSVFWQNDSSSVNQRPDFFDVIATGVRVYREDIDSFNHKQEILLANGDSLPTDAIIFATGWKNDHPYLSKQHHRDLGLPTSQNNVDETTTRRWEYLESQEAENILQELPILGDKPLSFDLLEEEPNNPNMSTPYRLYRSMLPLHDHSIVFLGHIMLGNHFRAAEIQALWAVALFEGNVSLPTVEEMQNDVAKTVQWCRHRYLRKGSGGNWFYYDLIPYTDMLLRDIGLKSHLQPGWKGLFAPAWSTDLKNLIQEYQTKYRKEVIGKSKLS